MWAMSPVGRVSATAPSMQGSFGGYSFNIRITCDAGQRALVTNAMFEGGLAELHLRCGNASLHLTVLSISQSASFTTISGSQASLQRSVLSISEVLDTWDASVDQFMMLFNVVKYHWISDFISSLSCSVVLYDSMGGPSSAKTLITSRMLLFAQ